VPSGFNVVVASGDGSFRRLAGAALSRAGHDVHTVTPQLWRVRRLIELRCPDVLVMEEGGELAGELTHEVARMAERPGLVLVSEKWAPVDDLVTEVERAAQARSTANGNGRPHLRLVTDDGA
jgi:hypothetical protein